MTELILSGHLDGRDAIVRVVRRMALLLMLLLCVFLPQIRAEVGDQSFSSSLVTQEQGSRPEAVTEQRRDNDYFTNPDVQARYVALLKQLRCPTCDNQSVFDSQAVMSKSIKRTVFIELQKGRSNEQIIDLMTQHYGEFIHYQPELSMLTSLLWVFPMLVLIFGVAMVLRWNKKRPQQESHD
ncbi:MAG: cytochrome c-type biogenesis protein [Pseudomonadota bacterium]|nr:cytochrome c-type biogenesis protein [Pseudomonadota bacterium]